MAILKKQCLNTPDKYTLFKKKYLDDQLTLSVGINGVTDLIKYELNSRYAGSKKIKVLSDGTVLRKIAKKQKFTTQKTTTKQKIYKVNGREIKNRIANWINQQAGKKSLYFYTISFPIRITDDTAYKCLNSWLTTARTTYKLKNYLWIAERQKNGTIHFHIALQEYLPVKKLNTTMKNLLSFYIRKNELIWSQLSCAKYNGVHISKDKKNGKVTNYADNGKQKNLGGYLSKYISKSTEKFKHQAWQCSKSLSGMVLKINMTANEFYTRFIDYIDIEKPIFHNEMCCYYAWKSAPPLAVLFHLKEVNQYILSANFDDFLYTCERKFYSNPFNQFWNN